MQVGEIPIALLATNDYISPRRPRQQKSEKPTSLAHERARTGEGVGLVHPEDRDAIRNIAERLRAEREIKDARR